MFGVCFLWIFGYVVESLMQRCAIVCFKIVVFF